VLLPLVVAGLGTGQTFSLLRSDGQLQPVEVGSASGSGVTSVTASSPLASSGGTTPNISHDASGVTPGTYTNATVTVEADGHVTAASSGSGGGGVTSVTASSPLASSGGTTPNITHDTSGVAAGTYTNATVTVEADGHVTAASSGTAPVTAVTATAPIASSGGATPNITHGTSGVAAGSYTNASLTVNADGHLTAASSGTAPVTSVTGTAPITSTGGATPAIGITAATDSAAGSMSASDKTKLDLMAQTTFLLNENDSPSGNVYDSWASLYAAASVVPGGLVIVEIEGGDVSVPAGSYALDAVSFVSGDGSSLGFASGANLEFNYLEFVGGAHTVDTAGGTNLSANTEAVSTLILRGGATLTSVSGSSASNAIVASSNFAGTLDVFVMEGSTLNGAFSPVIDDTNITVNLYVYDGSSVSGALVAGTGTTGSFIFFDATSTPPALASTWTYASGVYAANSTPNAFADNGSATGIGTGGVNLYTSAPALPLKVAVSGTDTLNLWASGTISTPSTSPITVTVALVVGGTTVTSQPLTITTGSEVPYSLVWQFTPAAAGSPAVQVRVSTSTGTVSAVNNSLLLQRNRLNAAT
jgi:hypothetical protein